MGRHQEYELNAVKVDFFLDLLRSGASFKDACALAGLSRGSVYRWAKRFPEFRDTVVQAKTFARIAALARIRRAAEGTPAVRDPTTGRVIKKAIAPDWRADAWYLERIDPYNFGGRIIESEGVTLRDILSRLDDEALRDQLRLGFKKKLRGRRRRLEDELEAM